MPLTTKTDKRAARKKKARSAPKGATRAGQKRRQQTTKDYKGMVKKI